LGLVTIGQSPRDDVMAQMMPFLPDNMYIRQVGALDGLTGEQIAKLALSQAIMFYTPGCVMRLRSLLVGRGSFP
jgi:hypothetical protein